MNTNAWENWKVGDIEFDTFISAEITADGAIVSEQVEEGSFVSYNKATSPLEITVMLGKSGEASELQDILDSLKELKDSTDVVSVVTPEAEYENMALESYSYSRRREDGVNVLFVELKLIEIREVESQTTTVQTKSSSAGKVTNSKNGEANSKTQSGKTATEETKKPYNSLLSRATK